MKYETGQGLLGKIRNLIPVTLRLPVATDFKTEFLFDQWTTAIPTESPKIITPENTFVYPPTLRTALDPEIVRYVSEKLPAILLSNNGGPHWLDLAETLHMREALAVAQDHSHPVTYVDSDNLHYVRKVRVDSQRTIGTYMDERLGMGVMWGHPYINGDILNSNYSYYVLQARSAREQVHMSLLASADRTQYDLRLQKLDITDPFNPPLIDFSGVFDRDGTPVNI